MYSLLRDRKLNKIRFLHLAEPSKGHWRLHLFISFIDLKQNLEQMFRNYCEDEALISDQNI